MKERKMGPKPKISVLEMGVIFEDLAAGIPTKVIAYNFGVNWSTLRHAIARAKKKGFEAWS